MVSTSRRAGRLICTPSEMRNFLGPGLIFGTLLVLGVPLFVDGGRLVAFRVVAGNVGDVSDRRPESHDSQGRHTVLRRPTPCKCGKLRHENGHP